MTEVLDRPPEAAARPADAGDGRGPLAAGVDRALDASVLVLATWTVVYHLCLVLRLGVPWAVGLEVAALAVLGAVRLRRRRERDGSSDHGGTSATAPGGAILATRGRRTGLDRALVAVVVVAALVAGLLVAVRGSWPAIAVLWLVAGGVGTVVAARHLRAGAAGGDPADAAPAGEPGGASPTGRRRSPGAVVALVWAAVLAVLASLSRWPNPDDLYYVNLSQWVAERGTFPLRDTIFSDLEFPMSSWPPVASFDALAGTVARYADVQAASVVYLVVPPLATALSVLALWRLLRAWRVPAVAVALSVALVYLLWDGGPGYAAPGNLFLIRLWQGKVVLLCLLVPLLLTYALRYVERPTRERALWLLAGGTAAVGLSTTAMFLVPLLAVGALAPLLLRRGGRPPRPRQALVGFAAMAAYPLAAGVVTLLMGGRSADMFDSRRLFRFEPDWFGREILRDGPSAVLVVTAVLVGALLVPHRAARVTTGLLVVVTGVTFVPGVTRLAYDLVGLGPTLWRVSWVLTIAALVGVLAARLATWGRRRWTRVVLPLALAGGLAASGIPIWTGENGVSLDSSPRWKRGIESVTTAERLIAVASPGDVVLTPEQTAITISVLTTRVKTVAPRDYFMDYLRDEPGFNYDERLTLVDFANGEVVLDRDEVLRSLDVVGVDQVCLPRTSLSRVDLVQEAGFVRVTGTPNNTCLAR